MNHPIFFDPKNSLKLFGLKENFSFLSNLYLNKKLPKVLLLTGDKGSGKSTLINHFLYSIFDLENYDIETNTLKGNSTFLNQFKNDIFSNIIFVKGADFKSVKTDDIRDLKTKILKSSILNKDRFIIFDDIDLFNQNSLNALLKIIEEPSEKNFFFLINNKSKPLLETIKSRSLEIKIILNSNQRLEIIENLINHFKVELIIETKKSLLSPGNFIKFNFICDENDISPSGDIIENISLLLNMFKKNKDVLFINIAFFIIDYYFSNLNKDNSFNNDKIYEIKHYFFKNLNNYMQYNLSQNSLINDLRVKLNNE